MRAEEGGSSSLRAVASAVVAAPGVHGVGWDAAPIDDAVARATDQPEMGVLRIHATDAEAAARAVASAAIEAGVQVDAIAPATPSLAHVRAATDAMLRAMAMRRVPPPAPPPPPVALPMQSAPLGPPLVVCSVSGFASAAGGHVSEQENARDTMPGREPRSMRLVLDPPPLAPAFSAVRLGVTMGLARLARRPALLALLLAAALVVTGALIERSADPVSAATAALRGTFRLVLPLLSFALVGEVSERGRLDDAAWPAARFGVARRDVALGLLVAAGAGRRDRRRRSSPPRRSCSPMARPIRPSSPTP